MFGVTISLTEKTPSELTGYLEKMKRLNADVVFASVQIPEENAETVKENLFQAGAYIREHMQEFVVDVSPRTFRNFSTDELKRAGVTGLRIDNGMTAQEIVRLSEAFKIVLNASTIDDEQIGELKDAGYRGDFEAWYNYYPRKNTGLDIRYFVRKNEWLFSRGIETAVFIAGDKEMRGTIFEGLPTLETHRTMPPLQAYLEMKHLYGIEKVILGDFDLQPDTFGKLEELFGSGIIRLCTENTEEKSILNMIHHNRVDVAADVLRSNEYRRVNRRQFEPGRTGARPRGTITIDNTGYGRYMGEMQIVLTELDADERVNVVSRVAERDLGLLEYIKDYEYPFVLTEE